MNLINKMNNCTAFCYKEIQHRMGWSIYEAITNGNE